MTPTPPPLTAASPKTHAERMAELRDYGFLAYGSISEERLLLALAYCDDLAAQLEAERIAHAAALQVDDEALTYANDRLKAAEEKLRAAEAVVAATVAFTERKGVCPLCRFFFMQEEHDAACPLVTGGFVTVEGKRTDAINPDSSTGVAGEGVG